MNRPPGSRKITLDGRKFEFNHATGRVRVGDKWASLTAAEAAAFAELVHNEVALDLNAVAVTRIRKKIAHLGLAIMSPYGKGRYLVWASR